MFLCAVYDSKKVVAIPFFVSFIFIAGIVMTNVVVAILLDKYLSVSEPPVMLYFGLVCEKRMNDVSTHGSVLAIVNVRTHFKQACTHTHTRTYS